MSSSSSANEGAEVFVGFVVVVVTCCWCRQGDVFVLLLLRRGRHTYIQTQTHPLMFSFFNDLFNGTPHHHLKAPNDMSSSMGQGDSDSTHVQYMKRVEGRKRLREKSTKAEIESSTSHEPHYVIVTDNSSVEVSLERPTKKIRLVSKDESKLLQMIPTEVLQNILSYCGSAKDRFAVQVTCKSFQRISNDSTELLANVVLGGDITGRGSLLREEDTPETASNKLTPYCHAGTLEAIYM